MYPQQPGYTDHDTSKAAAGLVSSRVTRLREIVLDAYDQGPMTPDEVAALIGEDILAVRPRCTELKRMGLLRKTGTRRANKSGANACVLDKVEGAQLPVPVDPPRAPKGFLFDVSKDAASV